MLCATKFNLMTQHLTISSEAKTRLMTLIQTGYEKSLAALACSRPSHCTLLGKHVVGVIKRVRGTFLRRWTALRTLLRWSSLTFRCHGWEGCLWLWSNNNKGCWSLDCRKLSRRLERNGHGHMVCFLLQPCTITLSDAPGPAGGGGSGEAVRDPKM